MPDFGYDSSNQISNRPAIKVKLVNSDTVNLTGSVVLDTFGALTDGVEPNPDAASATIPSLLRGLLATEAADFETVAANATAQVLGGAGAVGDFIKGILVVPTVVACGAVTLIDNATSITVFIGGLTTPLVDAKPFFIPLGMLSASGAWKITTGANVAVIAIGRFT